MAELRRMNRQDEPYQKIEIKDLVEAVKIAAFCQDPEATLKAFNALRTRAPDIAISSVTALRSLLSVGKAEFAESLAEEGLRKYPGFHALRVLHGEMARHRRDWPEMARRFEFMRRKFPDSVWGYVLGGVALGELEQFDAADRLLERAIAMEPLIPPPGVEYARLAERRGNLEEALRRWELVRERVDELAVWLEPARIMCRMGREDEAVKLLTKARWRFQGKPEPMVELALILHRRGHLEEAARQWQAVREQCPQDERGHINGARTLRELGRLEEAEAILQAYADRRDPSPAGIIEWARIVQHRDPREAAKRWAIMREKFPAREEGYVEGAMALDAIGEKEAAERLQPQKPVAYP
jgi:predicted Zn-dependent protease